MLRLPSCFSFLQFYGVSRTSVEVIERACKQKLHSQMVVCSTDSEHLFVIGTDSAPLSALAEALHQRRPHDLFALPQRLGVALRQRLSLGAESAQPTLPLCQWRVVDLTTSKW